LCITTSSFCLENYAIQMLTISSYAFLRPHLEVVHWASYHVGGVLPRFHVQLQLSVEELYMVSWWIPSLWGNPKGNNLIYWSQATEQAMEGTALRSDMPRKHLLHNCHGSSCTMSSGSVLLKPRGLLIDSTSVNFWCKEIMQHVNIATRVYCHSMAMLLKEIWPYHTEASHTAPVCHTFRVKWVFMKLPWICIRSVMEVLFVNTSR
jgi:hypothetical protein